MDNRLKITRELYSQHPDIPLFGKWVFIYQNRIHDYKGSLDTITKLREVYPLDKEINNSFVFDYYILDNIRGLGMDKETNEILSVLKVKVENIKQSSDEYKKYGTLTYVSNDKEFMKTLLAYQELMLANNTSKEIDKDKLDKVWENIPKNKYYLLDRYKGFDLSELGYVYGKYYNRKDILNAYIKQKEFFYDNETINKIKNAKAIVYDESKE